MNSLRSDSARLIQLTQGQGYLHLHPLTKALTLSLRHPDEALQVLQQAFLPLREKLTDYLRNGVERGTVRLGVDLFLAVDQLTGMLLSGMLHRHVMPVERGYHPNHSLC